MSKKSRGRLASWAQLRFSIIGGLLARPPKKGDLRREIEILASRSYQHPTRDVQVTFGVSTLERWYYQALRSNDPVQALKRKTRSDAGTTRAMSPELLGALARQYKNYSGWSYRLHADNVTALVKERPELGKAPSYSTVKRRMKERG
jgi:putative transposase